MHRMPGPSLTSLSYVASPNFLLCACGKNFIREVELDKEEKGRLSSL